MLSIQPKSEVLQAIEPQKKKVENKKDNILKAAAKRDETIVKTEVLPRLRHTLALTKIVKKLETFQFTTPLLSFVGYDVNEEEKTDILHTYYNNEEKWSTQGKGMRKILKKLVRKNVVFTSCEIDSQHNEVTYTLDLRDGELQELLVEEEFGTICAVLDKYLSSRLSFDAIASSIQSCYEVLTSDFIVEVYKRDLEFFPVLSLNVDTCIQKTDFYKEINISDKSLKIYLDDYLEHSKLLSAIKRKLRAYGYRLNTSTKGSENDVFRHHCLSLSVDMYAAHKQPKRESVVKSEQVREAFAQKLAQYDACIQQKMDEQNENLIQLVKNGHFDQHVAEKWMEVTLMSVKHITSDSYYSLTSNDFTLPFTVPFDRTLPDVLTFPRKYIPYQGVGARYVQLKENMLSALEERFPYLHRECVYDASHVDYKLTENSRDRDDYREYDDQLRVTYKISREGYYLNKTSILEWMGKQYGVLNIEKWLNDMDFTDEGISKRINEYVQPHANAPFQIEVGKVLYNEGLSLYKSHEMAESTNELFDHDHRKDFFSYYSYTNEFIELKRTEFKSIKIANLLTQALMLHPRFLTMKEELAKYDYELNIVWNKDNQQKILSGDKCFAGDPLTEEICEYSVSLVIK